ncbi:MAG TPA: hypothetical protein VGP07_10240 [Polyangia bacterium]
MNVDAHMDEPTSCTVGPLLRPSPLLTGGSRRTRVGAARRPLPRMDGDLDAMTDGAVGRLGNDTVSEALLAGWGMREISSILRWALSDLAVALMEVERRMLVADDDGGSVRRRTPARTARSARTARN